MESMIHNLKNGSAVITAIDQEQGHNWMLISVNPPPVFDPVHVGKWILAGIDADKAPALCVAAVLSGAVLEAKHMLLNDGIPIPKGGSTTICCFYLNGNDMEGHRKIIGFLKRHNYIRRLISGRYVNLSFKYNRQTVDGEYGRTFVPLLRLSDVMDLETGEWINQERNDRDG